ncbi:MAG: aminotransferase class V-fold PLP-dependent enzyme [Acidobacteriaceae bacterium]
MQNSRRSFMKLVAAAPLFVSLGARSLASTVAASAAGLIPTSPRDWNNNIYTRFGIRPIINCRGVFTYLTASVELPQVRKAAEEASHFFIDLFELQAAVGRHLAKMSGAESGMITSGSAGSIACATAGCIAGSDPRNIYQLPDTTGMKGEVIIMGGRSVWDSCIRLTGAKLIVAPTVNDLHSAITAQTAMIYTTWHDNDRITQMLKISKPAGVPLMVDQAAGIPPYSNFTRYAKLGVDLFCFSGGKGLMGPQVSGLLLGRKDLIDAALYNSTPWEGAICRPMKVGKEEMMACLAALDYWSKADIDAINKEWQRRMERLAKMVETVPGVQTSIRTPPPTESDSFPTLIVSWDEQKFGLTVAQCNEQLKAGEPRIEVQTNENASGVLARIKTPAEPFGIGRPTSNQLRILPITMQPGEELIVGNRLRQVLDKARKQSA